MRKIKVWLNSGANIHSEYSVTGTIEDVTGYTEEEWDALSDKEQESVAYDVAFNRSDWGFREL